MTRWNYRLLNVPCQSYAPEGSGSMVPDARLVISLVEDFLALPKWCLFLSFLGWVWNLQWVKDTGKKAGNVLLPQLMIWTPWILALIQMLLVVVGMLLTLILHRPSFFFPTIACPFLWWRLTIGFGGTLIVQSFMSLKLII